jgi:hypothetical protein
MRQNWHVAGGQQLEEKLLQSRRGHVVGRLDEDVAGVAQRHEVPTTQAGQEIWNDVIVGAGDELERNVLHIQNLLKLLDCLADLRARIVIEARQNMRRAGHLHDAVRDERACHFQRNGKVGRTIIDPRQYVTVQVDHVRRRNEVWSMPNWSIRRNRVNVASA